MKKANLGNYIELVEGTKIFCISKRLGRFILKSSERGVWNSLVLPLQKSGCCADLSFLWHSVSPSKRYVYIIKNPDNTH